MVCQNWLRHKLVLFSLKTLGLGGVIALVWVPPMTSGSFFPVIRFLHSLIKAKRHDRRMHVVQYEKQVFCHGVALQQWTTYGKKLWPCLWELWHSVITVFHGAPQFLQHCQSPLTRFCYGWRITLKFKEMGEPWFLSWQILSRAAVLSQ